MVNLSIQENVTSLAFLRAVAWSIILYWERKDALAWFFPSVFCRQAHAQFWMVCVRGWWRAWFWRTDCLPCPTLPPSGHGRRQLILPLILNFALHKTEGGAASLPYWVAVSTGRRRRIWPPWNPPAPPLQATFSIQFQPVSLQLSSPFCLCSLFSSSSWGVLWKRTGLSPIESLH